MEREEEGLESEEERRSSGSKGIERFPSALANSIHNPLVLFASSSGFPAKSASGQQLSTAVSQSRVLNAPFKPSAAVART